MTPGPLPVATWISDTGDAKIVLYDNGVLKVHAGAFVFVLASPWTPPAPEPEAGPRGDGEPQSEKD